MPALKQRFFVLTAEKLQFFASVDGKLKGEVSITSLTLSTERT